MTSKPQAEPRPMAKAQKSMMVPEDLYKLIEHQERRHGATFTRQAMAAFFQYFFTDARGPNPQWMDAVIAVEKGEITVGDVPIWLLQKSEQHLNRQMAEEIEEAEDGFDSPERRKVLTESFKQVLWEREEWEKVHRLADDSTEALLVFWKRLAEGVAASTIMARLDVAEYRKTDGEDLNG